MTGQAVTLATLIQQHRDKTGDSYSDIARRAGLSKAKIGQLAHDRAPGTAGQAHMPRSETLAKLARGLRLPLETVQLAAISSAGIKPKSYTGGSHVDLIATKLRELDARDLQTVRVLVDSLASAKEARKRTAVQS